MVLLGAFLVLLNSALKLPDNTHWIGSVSLMNNLLNTRSLTVYFMERIVFTSIEDGE